MADSTKVNHDLRVNDGATIYHMPEMAGQPHQGNLEIPNIFEESVTQEYPLGTRFVLGNRTFHYFKAGATIAYARAGIFTVTQLLNDEAKHVNGAHAVGDTTLSIDGTSDGSPVVNYYAGALCFIKTSSAIGRPVIRIVSSTKAAATGVFAVTLTLEQALYCVVADDTHVIILPNMYADCRSAWGAAIAGDLHPCVGVPARIMTANYYGWVQTWGPCAVCSQATAMGSASYDRTAVFVSDGSVAPIDQQIFTENESNQIAGYSLAVNPTSAEDSEWFIFLTVTP